jgi:hypothetical protein
MWDCELIPGILAGMGGDVNGNTGDFVLGFGHFQ